MKYKTLKYNAGAVAKRVNSSNRVVVSSVTTELARAQAVAKNKNDIQRFAATFAFRGLETDMNAKRNRLPLMRDGKIGFIPKDSV
ncbi:MAG: hypothetical protein WDO15_06315 [Bacteroidota bacterium]